MKVESGGNKFTMEAKIENLLDNIRNVGAAKPVGYLPIEIIAGYCKSNVQDLISESEAKGLKTKIFLGSEWQGYQGSLYVYDRAALQTLLDKDREILIEAGWPTEAEKFVAHLYVQVPTGTPLFKLIARAFGDKFSEHLE